VIAAKVCIVHGQNARVKAKREVALVAWDARQREEAFAPRDVSEALLSAAQEADVLVRRLRRALDDKGTLDPPSVEALGAALDRCARICKLVLDTKVDERLVRTAERNGDFWAGVIKEILAGLQLSPQQWEIADSVVKAAGRRVLEGQSSERSALDGRTR
jgi:hypothetical protein